MVDPIVVFDLDDTLYLERNFAVSGYQAVGHWMQAVHGVQDFAQRCTKRFDAGAYSGIFNHVLRDLGMKDSPDLIAGLVDIYRNHPPDITLEPDAARFLFLSGYSGRLGLITDGPAQTQANKINALGLNDRFDFMVRTGDWGAEFFKPHPRAFDHLERAFQARREQMVYVADNAAKDFLTPKARGWITVQIDRPLGIYKAPPADHAYAPAAVITSLDDLQQCLTRF